MTNPEDDRIDQILSEVSGQRTSGAVPPQPESEAPPVPSVETAALKKAKKHRYATWVRTVTAVGAALMILVGTACVGGGAYVWQLLDRIDYDEDGPGFTLPEGSGEEYPDESYDPDASADASDSKVDDLPSLADIPVKGNTRDVTNILLVGIDGRKDYNGRSDSNIILSINKKDKTIKLVSIMRDLQVLIPGYDINGDGRDDLAKFNVAYNKGINRTFRTIEQNFRIKIDQYVGVNFTAFSAAVDVMGGIDIELTDEEVGHIPANGVDVTLEDNDPKFRPISSKGGSFHLDGFQALQYVRIRKAAGNDFARVQRQQKVINILLDMALSNPLALPRLLEEILPNVATNMGKNEVLGYVRDALTYASYDIVTKYRLPQEKMFKDGKLRGSDVLVLTDQRESVKELHSYLYT